MNWGVKIIVIFSVFLLILFTMIFISFSKKTDLVSNDYYNKEIKYQQQIERLTRTRQLPEQPKIQITGESIAIKFPSSICGKEITGEIQLYFPADASKDKKIKIALDDSCGQNISITALSRGQWKIIINWKMNNEEYYTEQLIIRN